jgi:pyrroline-5-carboxylate reductase
MKDLPPFKIGIIGCGHVGTMILTKLLEIQSSFNNLQVVVSTRQPHLLRPFQQEHGIEVGYNNERVVRECDIIFVCVLPS